MCSDNFAGEPKETGEKLGRICGCGRDVTTGEVHSDWDDDELSVTDEKELDEKTLLALLTVLNFGGGRSSNCTSSSWSSVCLSRRAKPGSGQLCVPHVCLHDVRMMRNRQPMGGSACVTKG
jgi:hypothetical protein